MGIFNLVSKIFRTEDSTRQYQFDLSYKEEYIEIKIFLNNKQLNLNEFSEVEYEYLLNSDILLVDKKDNVLKLPYESIYVLDNETIKFFKLPEAFIGIMKIENDRNFLNKNGVKFEIQFLDGENRYIHEIKNIIFREKDGKRFYLNEKDYFLLQEILNYNSDKERVQIAIEQYKIVEKIKKLKREKEILIGLDIEKIGDIQLINNLEIDFEEMDKNFLKVFPILKDLDNVSDIEREEIIDSFKEDFSNKNLRKKYKIEINGKKKEIILNDDLIKALSVIKENDEKISKINFLKKDSPIFLDERMDIENLDYNYGPRVKGLGFLNYRAVPTINNSDIEWFNFELPYIDTVEGERIKLTPKHLTKLEEKLNEISEKNEDEVILEIPSEDGNVKLLMTEEDIIREIKKIKNSCKEIIDFKNSKDLRAILELMESSNEDYIEYKGSYVRNIKDRESIEELIRNAQKLEEEKSKGKKSEQVLLLKDNIDKLEHSEKIKEDNIVFKYEEPKMLKEGIELLPYQKEGVAIIQGLYNKSEINGILLSDDMGLGKTLQILVFLAWLKEKKKNLKGIIVVPTSLISNWYNESENIKNQGEIQKFFKNDTFKTIILKGKLKESDKKELLTSDLLILSYETLRINHIELGKIEWDVMVCDEAQKIKNPTTLLTTAVKTQNVKFKIACSATPIENTILDLWCLVDFSNPGLLGSLKEFKKKYLVNNIKENELKKINDELRNKLGNNFIRRTKDILTKQGKKFPKKILVYSHLPYSEEQKRILDKFQHLKLTGEKVLPLIQGMIMTCSHPKLIEKTSEVNTSVDLLLKESYKLLETKKILDSIKSKEEKAIIFTKYRKMQKILSILIKEWYGYNPSIINGDDTSEIRRKLLDKFRETEGFRVIILSPEAAGVGLNIVEANHVIHYTRHWNPAKEEQATDRAYRLGQKKDVFVYYPLVSELPELGEKSFENIDESLKYENFNMAPTSSPEEKLNKILLKKKRLLRDFFLAAPIDLDSTDFNEFRNEIIKEDDIIDIEKVDILDWSYLEAIAVILFEKKYNQIGFLTKKSGDFGVDGLIKINSTEFLAIQVKKSKNKVSKNALEEVLIGKNIYEREMKLKISKVAVVTNSEVTETLKSEINNLVEVIDRKELCKLLLKYPITFREIQEKLDKMN